MDRGQANRGPGNSSGNPRHERAGELAVCGLLLLAVGLVFGQTAGFGFVNYDDDAGVYENRLVTGELTLQGLLAVFTDRHVESTVPLTCISHMFVWHLLGHGAAVHHLTNVLLHAASAVLLFLVLRRMTGQLWPSALVAAVFAVHPLRAESVAWVTGRKDVLSGLLFMLTLWAYVGYARSSVRETHRLVRGAFHAPYGSPCRYLAVMMLFILGLAAKPMAVTLPFLLLLLDYWPLGRMNRAEPDAPARFSVPLKLILEKIPMLVIACLFCLWTVHGRTAAALEANQQYSFEWRTGNALISYAAYLGEFFCPQGLAPCYPRRAELPPWQVAAAVLLLVSITAAAVRWRRQRPYLLVGWLWYVGMLVPVIGLVQFGGQAEADRFTYLPQIGLTVALVWTAADACRAWLRFRRIWAIAAASAVMILAVFAWRQTSYWRDSETLWRHTLDCNSRNAVAHNNLGTALADRGRIDGAIEQYQQALDIKPGYVEAHNNLAIALASCGRIDEAIEHCRKALDIKPDCAEAYNSLGIALADCGRTGEAIANYEKALELKLDFAEAHDNLGIALASCGRIDEAIEHYRKALDIKPGHAVAYNNLGIALARCGRTGEAMANYRRALELKPGFAEAMLNLSWLLATCPEERLRNSALALDYARRAGRLCGDTPDVLHCLAAAYAEARMFPESLAASRRALELANRQGQQPLVNALQAEIRFYEAGKPWRFIPDNQR